MDNVNTGGTTTSARPTGVTILAVLAIIGGVLGLLGSLALLAGGGVIAASGATTGGGITMVLALILLATSILYLAFGFGAWGLKPWAWMLGVIGAGLSLLQSLLGIVLNNNSIVGSLVSIIIAAAILYYLFTPKVKAAFGRA